MFPYLPLWPFRTAAEARDWQTVAGRSGQASWHASAEATALLFTRQFLGFTEIDRVVACDVSGRDAQVSVGGPNEPGTGIHTAAVIHLARFGVGADAPWEVVGTRDDEIRFSETTPRYGAEVSSPLVVGGRLSGVDESIRVQVREISSARPLGTSDLLPAGGIDQPWSVRVTFETGSDPTATVVAWTGGHIAAVERFAVTGVRLRGHHDG
jgi:hypothetical protein